MTLLLLISVAFAQDVVPPLEDLVPDTPSWTTARKRMYTLYEGRPTTLYCGCAYNEKVPDLASCGMEGQESFRWGRTEAEHIVPISAIGITRPCWEEGGRAHCLKEDPVFKAAHNDLHNLAPSVGQLNAYRGNKSFGIVAEEPREYGSCDFEVDEETDRVEPRPAVRGDAARVYFYMEWMYGLTISEGQRRLLMHWHQTDPVDAAEVALDVAIEERQGNSNPFVR